MLQSKKIEEKQKKSMELKINEFNVTITNSYHLKALNRFSHTSIANY